MPRLRRVDCSKPGLARAPHGRGFSYADARGRPLRDEDDLARINALAIPPAWTDVWICADPLGHLQAVGSDNKGRRQYLYHEQWRIRRDRQKFGRMLEFGALLPKLRHQYGQGLATTGLTEERVLACGVALIDFGLFRVGSPAYTKDNATFGLCTIERRHVRISDGTARFDFPAKSGRRWIVDIDAPLVVDALSDLKARRGGSRRLLVARSVAGWRVIGPADVNRYIKDLTALDFSAKDLRTWNATVLAAVTLAGSAGEVTTKREVKAAVSRAVETVATSLGNTPTVARRSYIDPRVIDRFVEGRTIASLLRGLGDDLALADPRMRESIEEAVLDLLAD